MSSVQRLAAPVCVGLDPVYDRLPALLQSSSQNPAAALADFCRGVLDATAGVAPCVKIQAACFERYRSAGVEAMWRVVRDASERGFEVILDAKRGDIGISADHYAAACFGTSPAECPDWVTINSYLGADGITPFLDRGGAFALVRTSNPGSDSLQQQQLASGNTVAEHVASMIAEIGGETVGESGYSSLGAVVGATKPREVARLRELMPQQILLVPGYGSQGGSVDDIRGCFASDGRGAIVTASRSVIYAFDAGDDNWARAIAEAAARLADEIGSAAGLR